MGPSRVAGGLGHSSSSSGIFFQGDEQSHSLVNTHLSSSFGNSSNSIPGTGRSNLGPVSGDMNNAVLNSVANSGPSVGASSMVTDANSGLSGGPRLQRSASINTDSYMRLPASPMSFTSNNISISGSSIVDGSSAVQQGNHHDSNAPQVQRGQQQPGTSTATSLLAPQNGQMPVPIAGRAASPFLQDPSNLSQVQKKPRLDIKQEDILQQQALQQYLQRQDSMHLQSRNPQLQTLLQQQRLMQQQQILQSIPPSQRVQLQLQQQQQQHQQQQQQQQQMHLRQQMQQQGVQPSSAVKRSYDGGVCARRLMQFLYHQRQRPPENSIAYWRKVVTEYYSPRAKKRWCLSMYDNVGQHALGVFPQAAMEAWHCEICGSKSGRGFEATFEVLPRLNEIKFGSGVIDELLFLDLPRECRFPSGIMILEYGRAVQESIYENLRVVREGQLRIIFNQDLKILSWEFCARRHEELLPRRVIAPQVNQLLQVAQKCQSTVSEGGSDGVSQQDLQANSNMVGSAGRQLVKCLEIPALNDLGFSKRYVRSLQISEVVNSMKDLIDYSREHKVGPIEGLKSYPRHAMAAKMQMQRMREMEQLANVQDLPTDRNSLNNLMSLHPGSSNNHHMVNRGGLHGSAQAAMALTNFQNLLNRQNSMNSNPNSLQQDAASPFNNSPTTSYQGPSAFGQGSRQQSPTASSLLSPHLPSRQPHPLQRSLSNSSSFVQNQQQPSQGNQSLQQQMFQMLNDVSNNTGPRVQPHSLPGQNGHGNLPRNAVAFGSSTSMVAPVAGAPMSTVTGPAPTRSNSFKASSNSDSSAAGGINNGFNPTIGDFPQNPLLQDDIVQDIANGFAEDGFFNNDLDDDMGFGWKA